MNDKKVKSYSEVRKEVEKQVSKRGEITNSRGKNVMPRKYHATTQQERKSKDKWVKRVGDKVELLKQAGGVFYNPYRENGGYYGAVQALFLLGANKWHSFTLIRDTMREDMSTRSSGKKEKNSWEKFSHRSAREGAASAKDLMGRIIQNFRTLQRLGGIHPYGLKLQELSSSIDIQRDKDGIYSFMLNTTWRDPSVVVPLYNIKEYQEAVDKTEEVVGTVPEISEPITADIGGPTIVIQK